MNILVIGNGFDIAHGLKTKYEDFLLFLDTFMQIDKYRSEGREGSWEETDDVTYVNWIIETFNEANRNDVYRDFIQELRDSITNNIWVKYFGLVKIKEGWVNFEKEISRIIQFIDQTRSEARFRMDKDEEAFISIARENGMEFSKDTDKNGFTRLKFHDLRVFKSRLLMDLNHITRALELYLKYYVEDEQLSKKVELLPIISNINVERLISFNYTDTFERLYGKDKDNIQYDYIHGKAKKSYNKDTCSRLVIGIDEYLNKPEQDLNNTFLEFKKFYQRIYKRTGRRYKAWFEQHKQLCEDIPKANSFGLNIFFYGHSLDVTDRDIIADLIRQEDVVSTIFYHNREALGDYISNLVKIIGEEELIERTGNYRPSIIFKPLEDLE